VRSLKGQLSLEFMIVFVGMMIIVGVVSYSLYDDARADADRLNKLSEAREAANALANALNSLYAGGPGSKQTIEYWLPEGVVMVYANSGEDGVNTTDEDVSSDGRMDVQILFDFDGDDNWDNTRNSVVLVDTLLPSDRYENGESRDDNWVKENAVHIQDGKFILNRLARTHHRTTLEYVYGSVSDEWITLKEDSNVTEKKDFKLKTKLFGIKLHVRVENDEEEFELEKFRFGKQESGDEGWEGTTGTFSLQEDNITVQVVIDAPRVEVRYRTAEFLEPPYPRRILITDVIMEERA
jgi:uncharacterized protein (UPF0333 family)